MGAFKPARVRVRLGLLGLLTLAVSCLITLSARAEDSITYRCPGNDYKNTISEAKAKELADLNDKLKGLTGPGIGAEDLGKQIEQMKSDLTKATTELAESKQVVETLTQKTKEKEEALVVSENTVKAYKYNVVKNGLSGRILAFNPGWNFVVLSIGDKAGLKAGVNMVVTRGNSMIAKVKVTSVEPNTAIADIVPGTMRGDRVQAGDTVIYEGAR